MDLELSDREIEASVFKYLDKRKTQFNSNRVTIDELLMNTAIQKPAKANVLYKEWLIKSAKEKFDNESSTKKASEAIETKRQEEGNSAESTSIESQEETSKTTTENDSDRIGGTIESNDG